MKPLDIIGGQMDVINEGMRKAFKKVEDTPKSFPSIEAAEDYFYKHFDCLSDDTDKEWARVERWISDNEIEIAE
jgi:5-bromo-4-chloroindolyl phosphate hydrolysis protein